MFPLQISQPIIRLIHRNYSSNILKEKFIFIIILYHIMNEAVKMHVTNNIILGIKDFVVVKQG